MREWVVFIVCARAIMGDSDHGNLQISSSLGLKLHFLVHTKENEYKVGVTQSTLVDAVLKEGILIFNTRTFSNKGGTMQDGILAGSISFAICCNQPRAINGGYYSTSQCRWKHILRDSYLPFEVNSTGTPLCNQYCTISQKNALCQIDAILFNGQALAIQSLISCWTLMASEWRGITEELGLRTRGYETVGPFQYL